MNGGIFLIFIFVFLLFVMQSIGGYFQVKGYQKAVRRVHKGGNVGIGQKRGRFFSGHIAIISCDSDGIITGGEVLDGLTIAAKFHPITKILGEECIGVSIYDLLEQFRESDKKVQKRNLGYMRALEALEMRLNPEREDDEEAESNGENATVNV